MQKKILLLSTGGMTASVVSDAGLVPKESGEQLINMLGELPYDITVEDVLQLNSSNIQSEEWKLITEKVFENRSKYDGTVVSHGTDTTVYTASMLAFMPQNINTPVVLTGSQVPTNVALSDAPDNLRLAFAVAASCCPNICLAFDRKIMLGRRSVKVRTVNFDASESVNVPPVTKVTSDGLVFSEQNLPKNSKECTLNTETNPHVSLVKLLPGFDPKLLSAMVKSGRKGTVIEAHGLGGTNYTRRNMAGAMSELTRHGIPVIASSQCLYERSDLAKYEIGREALLEGAINARDMISENVITKLMRGLGQGWDVHQIVELSNMDVVGEVAIEKDDILRVG